MLTRGPISFTADPQLGKVIITADNFEQMCDRAVRYFTTRRPIIQNGVTGNYAERMVQLFSHPDFRQRLIKSNETFTRLPELSYRKSSSTSDILISTVAPVMIDGYRSGDGIDPGAYPTRASLERYAETLATLEKADMPRSTSFTSFSRGLITSKRRLYRRDIRRLDAICVKLMRFSHDHPRRLPSQVTRELPSVTRQYLPSLCPGC